MRGRLVILVILLSFHPFSFLFAGTESLRIEDYSYKDGLTTSSVYSAYKDSKGFLWICSINGLYRFDGYSFRKINSLVNGASDFESLCVTEDKDQNLWIGTNGEGVFHYNTHTEKITHVKLSTGNNIKVFKILFFHNKIWLATFNGLLAVTPKNEFNENDTLLAQVLFPDPENINSQINKITALYFFPGSETLWVGTNGSLFTLDIKTFVFELIGTHPQNSIRNISNYNNYIVVSSWDGGVFAVNTKTNKLENDDFITRVNEIIGDKRVMTAFFDEKNRLWIATYGSGIYIFEKNNNGAFSFLNYKNDEKQPEYLKSDVINQMYLDNSGIVWLCMNQPALSKVYYQRNRFNYYNLSEPGYVTGTKEITTLNQSVDKDKLWISTNGQGIFLFDTRKQSQINFNTNPNSLLQLAENDVSFCFQDQQGNLWIVYRRKGLNILPAEECKKLFSGTLKMTKKPIDANILLSSDSRINSYITKFYQDSDGRVWIGAWGSLYVVELKQGFSNAKNVEDLKSESKVTCVYITDRQSEINYPISPVLSIFEESKNHFWLGTMDAGIIELKETENTIFSGRQINFNGSLASNNIKSIYRDKKQNIWFGTKAGLCYWNRKNNVLKTFTESSGLASENINNIIEDKNSNIWLSTSYGISKVNTQDFSIKNYFSSDKDRLNQYIPNAAACSDDGLISFSSNDALITFNPDSLEINNSNSPLYFTDIKINNKTVNPFEKYKGTYIIEANINESKQINVPYNQTLNIEFAALDYLNSSRIIYKYRIGNKNEWITLNSNQRSLIMPSMKPGEYTLSIMLAGTSSGNIRTITLNYLPPFWQSKPAFLVYLVFLFILFMTYRRLITQRILQKSVLEKERYKRKKLEELDKMKSEFFTNISHEFRTPLSLIINPLEKLLQDEHLSDKNRSRIGLIMRSSDRLLKLTNELMDFSKIEKKLLKPEFQICEAVALVKDICGLFNNLADSMNIDYKINCPFDQFEIQIDKGMIEKVIFNLLSNAFKYTPNHGVIMVNISKSHDVDNDFIKISVINTGEGIAKDDLEKIFDRYYQVSNVQNRNIEGTGIGLSLIRSYIELHKGKVEVKSELNVETCFEIYLPVIQSGFEGSNISFTETISNSVDNLVGTYDQVSINKTTYHYQLLLVEDDTDIRNYVVDELSSDFKIVTARDGNEGLELANKIIPDLIITDVIMPGISGTELCIYLKKQVSTSHIPIIILSAKAGVQQQIEGLEMGADVYMIKPFNIDHLKTQVVRLLHFKENIYARFLKENALIPNGALNTKIDEEFFQKVLNFIEENLSDSELSVDQLANYVNLSKVQVYRKLKAISGQSVVEFIRTVRLKKAAQMVLEKRFNFSEIAYETGFSTPSYFTKCFHDHFGKTPSEFEADYGNK